MASTGGPSTSKGSGSTHGPHSLNSSILIEKAKVNARRSTPDSEALASSDDEADQPTQVGSTVTAARPARRSSWLNEIQSSSQRRGSLAGLNTLSPVSSQPNTPSADTPDWSIAGNGSALGRVASNGSYPWGAGIWGNEARREPPARLTEVLPSGDTSIPFAIPLHPTPKTYRSQSYSVGQMDADTNTGAGYAPSRAKQIPSPGLKNRSSRTSILNDVPHDGSGLSRVREVDDDDDSPNGSEKGVRTTQSIHTRTIEQLTLENAMLRQAAANQAETRLRNRAPSGLSVRDRNNIPGPVPEEDEEEEAVEDIDDIADLSTHDKRYAARRLSEYNAEPDPLFTSFATPPENRKLENIKKNQWHTSLGFGAQEGQQSRRHSFADIPTRHGSFSSEGPYRSDSSFGQGVHADTTGEYRHFILHHALAEEMLELDHLRFRDYAASYFQALNPIQTPTISPQVPQSTNFSQTSYGRPLSPRASTYRHALSLPQHLPGLTQPRVNQLLYVVTFKCRRADVFYVQEGVGLQVKRGDLVIVEADRGTDLGSVMHANVTWEQAKELKERYAEEHYEVLMMFSRHGTVGSGNGQPLSLGGAKPPKGSAIGGMGPSSNSQPLMQEAPSTDIKPKMIKRLAQNHEIQMLRDKEGNEAKAKRVCQQKVAEHRLNMEILDAEFQMDWKKLTFYYFADSYINFNSLVTDLFKVYKTRIWMSAINPASFATPTSVLQAGNVVPGSLEGTGQLRSTVDSQNYLGSGSYRNYGQQALRVDAPRAPFGSESASFAPFAEYQYYGQTRQANPTGQDFQQESQQQADAFSSYSPIGYGNLLSRFPAQYATGAGQEGSEMRTTHDINDPWVKGFQGLSLGSQ